MPRDPEYLAVLRAAVEAGKNRPALDIPGERAADRAAVATVVPEPVAAVTDLTVAGAAGPLPARLYRPAAGPLPGLVFFHGGGWCFGDIESYDPVARTLANATGAVVLSVGYRLAPEHPWPAAPDDAEAATRWALAHAAEMALTAVGVAGDSAGANLAAVVTRRLRGGPGPAIAAAVLVYPAVDLRAVPPLPPDPNGLTSDGPGPAEQVIRYLAGADPTHPDVSPLLADDLSDLPPTVLAVAEYDRLRAQGLAYADRLRTAGVAVSIVDGTGLDHGFLGSTSLARRPREVTAELGAAVRGILAGGGAAGSDA